MKLQIVVSLFVLFALLRQWGQYRSKRVSGNAMVVWLLLWTGVAVVFWSPELTSRLAELAGIGRGADLVIYGSIIVIFYSLYRIFMRLESLNREMTEIARSVALNMGNAKSDEHRDRRFGR